MAKHLHITLMATVGIATILSLTPTAFGEEGSSATVITSSTDDLGRTIYVNDAPAPAPGRASAPVRQNTLKFWSVTEHRWKPVPSANFRAARSAAEDVNRLLGSTEEAPIGSAGQPVNSDFAQPNIDAAIDQAAERHHVDPNLVRAVIKVESNFNPNAVSRKGAMGLMQLMPQTARQLNVSNPFDPEENVDAGVRHLKQLMDNYGGDIKLSLAAYNAGEGAVQRSAGIPHYAETRNYVKRITNLYQGSPEEISQPVSFSRRTPIHEERDARGVLHVSNTD
ncbi:MAG TPA: lytic transglycosylase domain-containing protein [Terriglobales bacterium]